jgi:hypothetical protein
MTLISKIQLKMGQFVFVGFLNVSAACHGPLLMVLKPIVECLSEVRRSDTPHSLLLLLLEQLHGEGETGQLPLHLGELEKVVRGQVK